MKRLAVLALCLCALAFAQPVPDLRGTQWTGYNAAGQNIGVNRIDQTGRNITFTHPNGQVTSGAYINEQGALYVPAWRSTGIISANGNRIDFKGGSMDGIYFVRPAKAQGGSGSYVKVNLESIGGVAGLRGGEIKYKGSIPIGGNVSDGGRFHIPWFSSNRKHTQKAVLKVDHVRANVIYVMASCAWWGWGPNFNGQPALAFRINGSVERDLIMGENLADWNAGTPSGRNTERVENNDQYSTRTFVTRLEFPDTEVTSLEIVLLVTTKADVTKLDGQQVIELFGVTLGRE